jgi:hypothetical protein
VNDLPAVAGLSPSRVAVADYEQQLTGNVVFFNINRVGEDSFLSKAVTAIQAYTS